jgi:hypothetical protein
MEIEFDVELKPIQRQVRPTCDRRRGKADAPKLTRLLVLAHQIEQAIEEGRAEDYAEVARQLGVSRARITQVVNLLLLSPGIQATILTEPRLVHDLSERQVRKIADEMDWHKQQTMFDDLLAQAHAASETL